jgi:hypothetical protein
MTTITLSADGWPNGEEQLPLGFNGAPGAKVCYPELAAGVFKAKSGGEKKRRPKAPVFKVGLF